MDLSVLGIQLVSSSFPSLLCQPRCFHWIQAWNPKLSLLQRWSVHSNRCKNHEDCYCAFHTFAKQVVTIIHLTNSLSVPCQSWLLAIDLWWKLKGQAINHRIPSWMCDNLIIFHLCLRLDSIFFNILKPCWTESTQYFSDVLGDMWSGRGNGVIRFLIDSCNFTLFLCFKLNRWIQPSIKPHFASSHNNLGRLLVP